MSNRSVNFAANVLKLTTGNVFAQVLAVAAMPVLTRLFAPGAFGIAALFVSIVTVLSILSCLRYELSIVLAETDEDAANLLGLSICAVLMITAITGVIVVIGGDKISEFVKVPEFKKYLWVLPLSVLINGFFIAFSYWNTRFKVFGRISFARGIMSATEQGSKLVSGFLGFVGAGILIGGYVLGRTVSTGVLGRYIWKHDRTLIKKSLRWSKIFEGMKRYKKFPIFTSWAIIFNNVSFQLPVWVLTVFFMPSVVGFYSVGDKVLRLPVFMIGLAISQVFLQKASEIRNSGEELSRTVEGLFKRLVALSSVFFVFLMLNGKDVFVLIFGSRWAEAGVFIQILSLSIFFSFITSPLSILFSVLERQGSSLVFNIVYFAISIVSLVTGCLTGDPKIAILLFAAARIFAYTGLCMWLFGLSGVPRARFPYHIAKYLFCCAVALGPMILLKWVFNMGSLIVLAAGAIGVVAYYFYIFVTDRQLKELVTASTKRLKGVSTGM